MRTLLIAAIATLSLCACATAQPPAWEADFSQPGAAESYRDDDATRVATAQVDGATVLTVTTPGNQGLEGVCIDMGPGFEGGRRYTARAEVRGSGVIWPMLISRNGWLYARKTVTLTGVWQEVWLTKPLDLKDDRMRLCILTKEQQELALQVRSVVAELEPAPVMWARDVPPVRFAAVDATTTMKHVVDMPESSLGRGVRDAKHMHFTGIPAPRASRPFFVHVRARVTDADSYFAVMAGTDQGGQRIVTVKPQSPGEWEWLALGPLTPAMTDDTLVVQFYGAKDPGGETMVDCIAVTTQAEVSADDLDAAPLAPLTGAPVFAATRAEQPPVIDGDASDSCWQQAVVLSNFVRRSNFTPAAHASEMRLSYDDGYLYWYFRGEEPVLKPEQNRLHEFKKSVTERDARVYKDDSVMLIIDPRAAGGHRFDFTINALGTVEDARIDGEDLWGDRDTSFDAEVDSASVIGDGFWTVEARISLASLGLAAPAAGDSWGAIVGRIEQADDETTSWNACRLGFHDPQAFAEMRFTEGTSLVRFDLPERLQLGDNPIAVTTRSAGNPSGVYAYSRIERAGKWRSEFTFTEATPDGAHATAPLRIEEEGAIGLSYGAWDAVTLQPLLISPSYQRNVKSSVAMIALESEVPFTLLVNGTVIARGASSSADEPIRVFLQKGVNAFGLELERGVAQVSISAGEWTTISGANWRLAPDDVTDFSAPEVDPGAWAAAVLDADNPASIGDPDGPTRMRFALLWRDTRVFPNPTPALYLARGTDQHFTVAARGLPGHKLTDYKLRLALPEGLLLTGVTGYYNSRDTQPEFAMEQVGTVQIGERELALHIISADQPIPYRKSVRILELLNPFLAWDEAAGEPSADPYTVYFASEALGGAVMEPWQELPVVVLPALRGEQPQELVWQLWGSFFSSINQSASKLAALQTARQAGFNDIVSGDRETSDLGDGLGIDNAMSVNFEIWSINMHDWVAENPDQALIDRDGEASIKYACTSAVLDEAYPHIDATLKRMIAERHVDVVDWDYESHVMTSYIACFCPRCLAAFRQHAGIAADQELTGGIIEKEHFEAWTSFMCERMAKVARRFKESANSADPPAEFSIYSGYQSADTKWRYGVDWEIIGDLRATDRAECGYGFNWEWLMATHEALQGIPLVCGKLMHPYDRNSDEVPSPATKAVMLRRLLDSTGGILLYDRMVLDGRSWHASAEASRLASAYEDVIARGDFPKIDGLVWGAKWCTARGFGDTLLIGVFNLTGAEKTREVPLPGGYATCEEFYGGGQPAPGETLTVTLAPGDAEVFVLRK